MPAIDRIRPRLETGKPPCRYDEHMGFTFHLAAMERGRTVLSVDVGERFHNPNDVAHGGLLSGLADSAMGSVMFTVLDDGETCTNVDLSIKFLRPTGAGTLRAEGSVLKTGRKVCVAEARITDEDGRLVARAESTFLRMPA